MESSAAVVLHHVAQPAVLQLKSNRWEGSRGRVREIHWWRSKPEDCPPPAALGLETWLNSVEPLPPSGYCMKQQARQ